MSQLPTSENESELTIKPLVNGSGHSRTPSSSVLSTLGTLTLDEPADVSQALDRSKDSHPPDPLPGWSNRGRTSQPEPAAIDFVELKDGSLVDIVEDPGNSQQTLFALWKDGNVSYHRQLDCDSRWLIPLPRTGEIMQHVSLARSVERYKSTEHLLHDLSELIQRCVSVKEDNLLPLASFILVSWVVDRLHIAPYLSVIGLPQSGKTTLLGVLSLVCRRSLLTADITSAAFYQACDQLMVTLLIDDCDPTERSRELRQLLRMGTTPGVVAVRKNKVFTAYGPKVIAWNEPPSDLAIKSRCVQIEMVETDDSDLASVVDEETKELASKLRNQLLQFRFEHYRKVRSQKLPGDDRLRPRSRDLLRCLSVPYADKPKICEYLTAFFKERDILKREPLPRRESVVLAALFSEIHQRYYDGFVAIKNLAGSVNQILRENGEHIQLEPRKVGAVLSSFGISHRLRTNQGYVVVLEEANQERIHKLAHDYGIDHCLSPSVKMRQEDCPHCNGVPLKKATESAEVGESTCASEPDPQVSTVQQDRPSSSTV